MDRGQEPQPAPTPTEAAASVSAVIGNDDLLHEILLRIGFPTCLVRAALVSKRSLRLASDPAFLRRFRDLHPPRLLGFYLRIRRTSLTGDDHIRPRDCRNGRLLVRLLNRRNIHYAVLSSLHPARGTVLLPTSSEPDFVWTFLPKDSEDIHGVMALDMQYHGRRVYAQVCS